jgi:vitamin B12 transporter
MRNVLNIHTNNHFGAGYALRKSLLVILLLACNYDRAQVLDTNHLGEIEVKATRINSSATGKKLQKLDSLTLELFKNQTLDAILSNNTPIYVKNYGPGALQTTTFRGGNASQTAILWNGLNIQNSMLGQTDLSNISGSLFNAVDIEYGGSSSLWGSGAMGGAVHLNNKLAYNKGTFVKVGTVTSPKLGLSSTLLQGDYSDSLMSVTTKVTVIDSDNTYSYRNDSNDIVQRKNASFQQNSFLTDAKFRVNRFNSVTISGWITDGLRNLPSLYSIAQNKIQQADRSKRFSSNWNYNSRKVTNVIKAAYILENLDYADSLAKIDSKSKMQTRIIENDLFYKWRSGHVLNFGFNYTFNKAFTENYYSDKSMERYAFVLAQKDEFLSGKLSTHVAARFEHTTIKLNPFTFSAGADYRIHPDVLLKLNAGKVYRIPTLNDLYWVPGGNPQLKPEEGYTADGTAEYYKFIKKFDLTVSGSVFYKLISNWIQWIPYSVGSYKPVNLQEVYSRGSETTWQLGYTKNKFRVQLKCLTSYVLSTVNKTILDQDPTLNKQLIYTPRYTVNSSLTVRYSGFTMAYIHTYVGYRFTASDNSAWIMPYHYSTLRVMLALPRGRINGQLFANINNILNKDYEVLLNVPQPLRYSEAGIQITFNSHKKANYKSKKNT